MVVAGLDQENNSRYSVQLGPPGSLQKKVLCTIVYHFFHLENCVQAMALQGTTRLEIINTWIHMPCQATTMAALSGNYHGSVGLSPARLYNPTFAWESNRKFEGGIELGFVEDHIRISTSYYNNRSSSQLVSIPLAPTTGFTNIQGNLPAVIQNSGLEIEINTSNLERSYFSWSTSFNTTVPKSSLVEFPNLSLSPVYDIQYVVGQPLEIQKLYQHQGIDATTGVYQFADINEDGTFDVNDRKQVKFFGRKFFGGVQNSFRFHGVKLDILFQFVKQQGFNYTHLFGHAPGTLGNQPDLVMNRCNLI